MIREELIESLTILKEQAQHYGDNTFIWSINIDSFKFVIDSTIKALEQEPILDKIRKQIMSNLKGVDIALEVLGENHPLRQKMKGAKDTLVDCLELIDKAEMEDKE